MIKLEAVHVFYKNEDGEWTWMAECCNESVAEITAQYWADANSGEEYAYGTSKDDLRNEFCR